MLTYISTSTNDRLTSAMMIDSEEEPEELDHKPISTDLHSEPTSLSTP
jgi:hypothetical protein